jgi:ParB-like chromosome segregation protein Spo0J
MWNLPKYENAYTVTTDLLLLIGNQLTRRTEARSPHQIEHLDPGLLRPNAWNSNRVGPEMEKRLRASILEFGLYKPIIVRQGTDGTLEILGGEHRWRVASDMGYKTVPVVNLGAMSDEDAKLLGLADNGQYGEDDSALLTQILKDIGQDRVNEFLPYSDGDLAGMFAVSEIDLDSLGFDDDDTPELKPDAAVRPAITHELMRFKVPVEDRERVQKFIEHVVNTRGLKTEADSMVASGMALVLVVNAARELL